jgi:alpha-L-rhamnosidase
MNDILSCFSFTIHGFRYISVLNPPSSMNVDNVECIVVHSETTVVGHFSSSNPIINQIQHNIQWGQLSNIMSLPTDWSVMFKYSFRIK